MKNEEKIQKVEKEVVIAKYSYEANIWTYIIKAKNIEIKTLDYGQKVLTYTSPIGEKFELNSGRYYFMLFEDLKTAQEATKNKKVDRNGNLI